MENRLVGEIEWEGGDYSKQSQRRAGNAEEGENPPQETTESLTSSCSAVVVSVTSGSCQGQAEV